MGRKGKLDGWTMRDLILVLKFPSSYVTSFKNNDKKVREKLKKTCKG